MLIKKFLLLAGSVIIISTVTAGCSPVEKTLKLLIGQEASQGNNHSSADGNKTSESQTTKVTLEPLSKSNKAAADSVVQGSKQQSENASVGKQALSYEQIEVVLYFGSKDGSSLKAETRMIPKVPGIARATIEQLIKGPAPESGLVQTIPNGVKLLDINVKPDGLAIVSFNQALKTQHWGGSQGESLTVYSIVDTLTQFPSIKRVQLLIEDQAVETLAGHLGIAEPLLRNSELIKE